MEIQGKVIAVLPIKDGVGKTSGNEWKSREFVLETEESRPQSLCLQLMNANIDRYSLYPPACLDLLFRQLRYHIHG